jgi:hypothetical protein
LIDEHGLDFYSELMANRWYDGEAHGISDAMAERMREHANLAFGEWYRKSRTARRAEYVQLIEAEAGVHGHQPIRARKNALYLIKHSVPYQARRHGYLERVFSRAVDVLSHDREVMGELHYEVKNLQAMLARN